MVRHILSSIPFFNSAHTGDIARHEIDISRVWISESDVIGVGHMRPEKEEYADENSTIVRVVQKKYT